MKGPIHIAIQDGQLPHEDLRECVTPDWQRLVDFYPEFCRRVVKNGSEPMAPQAWMMMICKQLEKQKIRRRSAGDWISHLVEHFGSEWSTKAVTDMAAAKTEAMETTP